MLKDFFYQNLKSFHDFIEITNDSYFEPIPDSWNVVLTDVVGSTKAIESGRYKDVNTVGAASIAAVQNILGKHDFPFVFGGDGATMLIPPEFLERVLNELRSLKVLSESKFGLSLRIGRVGVRELVDEGAVLEVAKHEIAGGRCVAIFRGGGLTLAEKKIKSDPEKYGVGDAPVRSIALDGLSCRWNQIPNKRGKVLSLMLVARSENHGATYAKALEYLNEVFGGELSEANPVNLSSMSYRTVRDSYENEKRFHSSLFSLSFLFRLFEIIASVLIFRYKIPPLLFNPTEYSHGMRAHSDYRKFDDMLRMVIDCSHEQFLAIRDYMEKLYQRREIYYGLHESDSSLMTCYVQGLNDGEHIHFIDGGDGGYAMAAKQMKAQMRGDG